MAESQNLRPMESSTLEQAFRVTESSSQPELSGPSTTPRPSVPCPCSGDEAPLTMQKSPLTPNLMPLMGTQLPISTPGPFLPDASPSSPPKAKSGFVGNQEQDAALTLTVYHAVGLGPSVQPMQIPLPHVAVPWSCAVQFRTAHTSCGASAQPLEPSV